MTTPLAELVPTAWRPHLEAALVAPSFQALEQFLEGEWRTANVLPPKERIFAALHALPPEAVKVVLLGQDPYPTKGVANGLSFSVSPGVKIPPSLRNLDAGLELELGVPKPTTGDLSPWVSQGVLLLNTVLTVREGEAASHKKKGWEPLTERILHVVNAQPGPVVFLALGKPAQAMAEKLVDTKRHVVVAAPHPSPLNGTAFVDAAKTQKPFTQVNAALVAGGRTPIEWRR